MKKRVISSAVLVFAVICGIGSAYGGWPAPPWADLPQLDYIYAAGDTIWFYSKLEVGGFPPRYVVTYEKAGRRVVFHPVSTRVIPEDAPIDLRKSGQLPSNLLIKPKGITFRGTRIPLPVLTSEEAERLREWSTHLQSNRHLRLSQFSISNGLHGSLVEVEGVYYFGMKGGISEGRGHLGGLAIYRPSEGLLDIMRSKYLVDCSVTDITRIGDELAISTVYSGESGGEWPGSYWEAGEARGVGLVLYNLNTGKWRHIPFQDQDTIVRQTTVVDGWLWMTTNLGISCYQPELNEIRSWWWELRLTEKR